MLAAEATVDQTELHGRQPDQQLEHTADAPAGSKAAAACLKGSQVLSHSSLNGSLASAASAGTASNVLLSEERLMAGGSQRREAHNRLHYQIVRAGQVPPPSTVGCSCIYVLRRGDGRFYCGQTDNMKGGLAARPSIVACANFCNAVTKGTCFHCGQPTACEVVTSGHYISPFLACDSQP